MYRSLEAQADVELPADYQVPAEFVIGRLMYPSSPNFGFSGSAVATGSKGERPGRWTIRAATGAMPRS